jgi:hypothetical protein
MLAGYVRDLRFRLGTPVWGQGNSLLSGWCWASWAALEQAP